MQVDDQPMITSKINVEDQPTEDSKEEEKTQNDQPMTVPEVATIPKIIDAECTGIPEQTMKLSQTDYDIWKKIRFDIFSVGFNYSTVNQCDNIIKKNMKINQ